MVFGLLASEHGNKYGLRLGSSGEGDLQEATGLGVDALEDDLGVAIRAEEGGLRAERENNVAIGELAGRGVLDMQGNGSVGVDRTHNQVAGLAVVADDHQVAQGNVAEGGVDAIASGVLLSGGLGLNQVAARRTKCNSSSHSGGNEDAYLHGLSLSKA